MSDTATSTDLRERIAGEISKHWLDTSITSCGMCGTSERWEGHLARVAAEVVQPELERLNATVARVSAVHHLIEWVSLSDVCARHHWFRQVGPTPENIAIADVCPDCRPRRYMACVCAEDPCPVLVALDQPEAGDRG